MERQQIHITIEMDKKAKSPNYILCKKREISILILLCLSFYSCKEKKSTTITIKGFNSIEWIKDSLGCEGVRRKFAKVLDSNSNTIISNSKGELVSLLGPPNIEEQLGDNMLLTYFVGPGKQCTESSWRLNKYYSAEQISFYINSDEIVTGSTGINYP